MPQADQRSIVIISHDVVGTYMAGPGIRYYHLARVLGQILPVTLAVPAASTLQSSPHFSVIVYQTGEDAHLEETIRQARAVLIPAVFLVSVPMLLHISVPLIVDGYDPFVAETLAFKNDMANLDTLQVVLTQAYLRGDFFVCASERQRDWWLGLLEANGRINAWTFQEDASFRKLVDVVAYGHPETKPQHARSVIKGVWPGIGTNDRVILWGGGLWSWLDPLTAIRAVAQVWSSRKDVRLIFPGTKHPNPSVINVPSHNQTALQLAEELGLLDKAVFFGDWVAYQDWSNVLLESDIALTLHYDTLETRLAFRSRVLEYIWAGLPVISTQGDATSELIAKYEVGHIVDYEDVSGVAEAMLQLLETPHASLNQQFKKAQQSLTWEQAALPLINFCRHPHQASDKMAMGNNIGNPFYLKQIVSLQALIKGYEQGRFIRLMRWFHQVAKG